MLLLARQLERQPEARPSLRRVHLDAVVYCFWSSLKLTENRLAALEDSAEQVTAQVLRELFRRRLSRSQRTETEVPAEVWERLEAALRRSAVETVHWGVLRSIPAGSPRQARLQKQCDYNRAIRLSRPYHRLLLATLCERGLDCHRAARSWQHRWR